MSNLINYTPQPDHFGDVCKQINEARSGILRSNNDGTVTVP